VKEALPSFPKQLNSAPQKSRADFGTEAEKPGNNPIKPVDGPERIGKDNAQGASRMRFTARIEIHDNDYILLHGRMKAASFSRSMVDSSSGKRVQLPLGEYVSDAYASAQKALFAAMQASLPVDFHAEIVVSGGGKILTHGCPEVEENVWSFIFSSPAQSKAPMPLRESFSLFQN
jgi:hypothetical protein